MGWVRHLRTVGLATCLVACGDKDEDTTAADDTPTEDATREIEITFRAVVDDADADCDTEFRYVGLGATASMHIDDLRMLVSSVGMIDAGGSLIEFEIDGHTATDGTISLIDLLPNDCNDESVGATLRGTMPNVETAGLAFTLGVPFADNHPAPDAPTVPWGAVDMFLDRLQGYTFFKLDARTTGEPDGYPVHIHSSGCQTDDMGDVSNCLSENLRTFVLDDFDPNTQVVELNLAELLRDIAIDQNTESPAPTPAGCQSDPSDADCQAVFEAYGLGLPEPTWITAAER